MTRLATLLAALAVTRVAAAEEMTWLSAGVNLGRGVGGDGGFLLGGELSVFRLDLDADLTPRHHGIKGMWIGGYLDVLHDYGASATRFSIGPEIGESALGVDGGYLVESRDDGTHHGLTARLALTAGVFALYGRFAYVFGAAGGGSRGEFGVLLKLPLPLAR